MAPGIGSGFLRRLMMNALPWGTLASTPVPSTGLSSMTTSQASAPESLRL